ncbi:MAG TPA: penicillin acylase family protein [Nitriliruptoraceae bacterium]|nr:penicillin acylase family protein [Nitriliruptoraceae bacterium]
MPGAPPRRLGVIIAIGLLLGTAVAATAAPGDRGRAPYRAEVTTTAYGMPHIRANDIGSLGFGNGWAAARDNLCVIAEFAVTTDGERSQFFGPTQDNVVSDVLQGWLLATGRVDGLLASGPDDRPPGPSEDARAQVEGFAAGYNRHLADIGGADGITDPACAGADWVRPLTADDVWRRSMASSLRASAGALAAGIVAATPPSVATAPAPSARGTEPGADAAGTDAADGTDDAGLVDDASLDTMLDTLEADTGPGSNAYGLGSTATQSGNGIVLGNPHFPWDGPDRFWQSHQTIPGELDVQGGALLGTPGVQIGFNDDVAWSHTVSTAQRFSLRLLQLVPGAPTKYVVDGEVLEMEPTTIDVPGGPSATVWNTVFGPVVVIPGLGLGWTTTSAAALDDANADNLRTLDQWNAMNRASSVDELVDAMSTHMGIPWVNTTGADRHGNALYAQLSVTTGVPDALAQQCIPAFLQGVWQQTGTAVLAGTTHACDPIADPSAPTDGILGAGQLPVLVTDEWVTQSNDSHWLSNPDMPLEGFARVIGDQGTARSLRTRLGIMQVQERLDGSDGLGDPGFTVETVQEAIFGNRHLGAELVVDDLVAACRDAGTATAADGRTVDLDRACDVLDAWDRRVDLESVGAVLFREFGVAGGLRFAVGFDPANPVTTPNTLDTDDPAVLRALATAVTRLDGAGIALDVALGDVQSEDRNGAAIPMHGGRGNLGVFNVLSASFQGAAGYPDVDGNSASLVMAVEMTDSGPVGEMLLTYSQSSDSTSDHFADQTRLYSDEEWVPIHFQRGDVNRNRVERVNLVEPR